MLTRDLHSALSPSINHDLGRASFNLQSQNQSVTSYLKLVTQFAELQFKAYQDRLELQPNGGIVKERLARESHTPQAQLMKFAIGKQVLGQLGDLGQDVLKLLRRYGEMLLINSITGIALGKDQSFQKNFISGLTNDSGENIFIAPEVLLTVANIFHNSWKNVQTQEAFKNHSSATGSLIASTKVLTAPSSNLHPLIINHDSLTAMMLCKQLAKLTSQEFQEILNYSKPNNPFGLNLTIGVATKSSNYYPEISLINSRATEIRTDYDKFKDIQHPEIMGKIDLYLEQIRVNLIKVEARILEPIILTKVDHLATDSEHEFETICQSLEEIRLCREQFLLGIKFTLEALPELTKKILLKDSTPSDLILDPTLKCLVSSLEDSYQAEIDSFVNQTTNTTRSLISINNFTDYKQYADAIEELIQRQTKNPNLSSYSEKGGIIYHYYQENFWKTFFEHDGQLLVSTSSGKLQGFLIYYQPAKIPEEHTFVPQSFRKGKDRSYTELIVVSPDRTSGTFHKLFRGMLAKLQLTTAKFSEGIVYSLNNKSLQAVSQLGYFLNSSQAIPAILRGRQESLAIPVSIPVQSKLRQGLAILRGNLAKQENKFKFTTN